MKEHGRRHLAGVALVLLASTLAGCENNVNPPTQLAADFVTVMKTEGESGQSQTVFEFDEPVVFVVRVTNLTHEPKTLHFNTSCQEDFWIRGPDGEEVWHPIRLCLQVSSTMEFGAGETKTESGTWRQIDNDGAGVAAGDYTAQAALIPSDDVEGISSNVVSFTLK
jgi:hypothetical protein